MCFVLVWFLPSSLPPLGEAVAPGLCFFLGYSFFHVLVTGPGTGRLLVSFCFSVVHRCSPVSPRFYPLGLIGRRARRGLLFFFPPLLHLALFSFSSLRFSLLDWVAVIFLDVIQSGFSP